MAMCRVALIVGSLACAAGASNVERAAADQATIDPSIENLIENFLHEVDAISWTTGSMLPGTESQRELLARGKRAVPAVVRRVASIYANGRRNDLHFLSLVSLLVLMPGTAQTPLLRAIAYDDHLGMLVRVAAIRYLTDRGLRHPKVRDMTR